MKSRFETEAKVMAGWYVGFPLLTILITLLVLQFVGAPHGAAEPRPSIHVREQPGPLAATAPSDPTFADVLKVLHGTTFRKQLGDVEAYENWQTANILDQEDAVPAIYEL